MEIIPLINIVSTIVLLTTSLLIIIAIVRKKVKWHIGLFLIMSMFFIILVTIGNVLEHLKISDTIDKYEEYLEIMIIPYFLLFIYSITVDHEITLRKEKEERLIISLNEKEILIKEIHHRVKNNLQLISSFLSLQKIESNEKDLEKYFNKAVQRINTIGLFHQQLYGTEDFTKIEIQHYINTIINNLIILCNRLQKNIKFSSEGDAVYTNLETAVPLGLILNEIVSNSIMYAFPDSDSGHITIVLNETDNGIYSLSVSDNGIGIPDYINFDNCGLGMKIIQLCTKQLFGEIKIDRRNGTKYTILLHRSNKEEGRWIKK